MSSNNPNLTIPGIDIAKPLGYDLHSHTSDRREATYMRTVDGKTLFLKVVVAPDGQSGFQATLEATHRLVQLRLGPFSFPHKLLARFEAQVLECLP